MKLALAEQTVLPAGGPPASPLAIGGLLASLSISILLSSLGTSIANVGLPAMAAAFSASFRQTQWIVLAYLVTVTSLIVLVGRLGDLIGYRRLLMTGIALFAIASFSCATVPTLGLLVVARAVQGLGAAIMMALATAYVGEAVPQDRVGSAMGLLATMSAIGTALGPSLGGLLIFWFDWRAIFFINVPLAVLGFFLAYRYLPADQVDKSNAPRFDKTGALLLAASLVAYAFAMSPVRGGFGIGNIVCLSAAAGGASLFAWSQSKAASPLLSMAMFHDRDRNAGLVMNMLVSTVMMATLIVGPFYLSGIFGLHSAMLGLALSAGPLVAACTGIPAGRLSDIFGTHRIRLAGLVLMVPGLAIPIVAPASFGISAYIIPLVIATTGYGLFQTSNNLAVMAGLPSGQRGVISGLLNLSRNLGLLTGASMMGAVFASAVDSGDIATVPAGNIAAGMQNTFMLAVSLLGIALTVAIGNAAIKKK